MRITCDKCKWVIDRDQYADGELVEEYKNTFGTTCPNCWHVIKPLKKPFTNEKKEMEMAILQEEMRDRLRKNIKGEI
jgi:hypothetical protein